MNIFPCKLVCQYKNPPYRELVLSPYVSDYESAMKLTQKFIVENAAYSIHKCSIFLLSGDNRCSAQFIKDENGTRFEEVHAGFESNTCS